MPTLKLTKRNVDTLKPATAIGRHGSPWTPDAARDEAKRLIGDVTKKIDPAAQRRADREAMTFATLCDLYLAEGVAHKRPLTIAADKGRVEHHLKLLLGKKRVVAIGRDDIERLLVDVKSGKTKAVAPEKRKPGTLPQGGVGGRGSVRDPGGNDL